MARASFSIVNLLGRKNPCNYRQNTSTQIRKLVVEAQHTELNSEQVISNKNPEHPHGINGIGTAKDVSVVTSRKQLQTPLTDFPLFNVTDPRFFREILKHQNNALLSLMQWLRFHYEFVPDQISCNVLFDLLLDAEACGAAKYFLDISGFIPEQGSLERYICCFCNGGLVQDAINVLVKFKEAGVCPSIQTWNSALLGCIRLGRSDLVWKLYQDMIDCGIVADANVETIKCLIQAFCNDGKLSEGDELLRQALEDGLEPGREVFNRLIQGFSEKGRFAKVSELIHIMIAKNYVPDIYTYHGVISGLCKNQMWLEALRVFNDLKDRGYTPDRDMYITMIHGLCEMKSLDDARKLWLEMINKGIPPNQYSYYVLIQGCYKMGNFEDAKNLHKEMCDKGYGETMEGYNIEITRLCLHGSTDKAFRMFQGMSQKGIVRNVITYNALIQGFCRNGRTSNGMKLLNELLAQGLQPSTSSYIPLIEQLIKVRNVQEAKKLWNDMENRGLEPMSCHYDLFIAELCKQGNLTKGMQLLFTMMKNKLKPEMKTVETLVQCLLESNRLNDSFLVLRFMFRVGFALRESIWYNLVSKFCQKNPNFVETCLDKIL